MGFSLGLGINVRQGDVITEIVEVVEAEPASSSDEVFVEPVARCLPAPDLDDPASPVMRMIL